MIAATGELHNLTVVSRNVRDFERLGATVLNPFSRDPADRPDTSRAEHAPVSRALLALGAWLAHLGAGSNGSGAMNTDISLAAALFAGLLSFLSPCVLPLVPPYLVYLAGTSLERLAGAEPEPAGPD